MKFSSRSEGLGEETPPTGGGEVCPGDAVHALVAPPPFDPGETAIHRLALQVEADVAACTPVVPVAESCEPLRSDPACSFRTTFPVEGAGEPGAPMLFEDVYDCETDRRIETVAATAGLACPPPVRGLGDDLVTPLTETNDSFAEAAAAQMRQHTVLPDVLTPKEHCGGVRGV